MLAFWPATPVSIPREADAGMFVLVTNGILICPAKVRRALVGCPRLGCGVLACAMDGRRLVYLGVLPGIEKLPNIDKKERPRFFSN